MRSLHHACNTSKEGIIDELLANSADPNAKDENDNTSMHYACARGILNVVNKLLNYSADPDAPNTQRPAAA